MYTQLYSLFTLICVFVMPVTVAAQTESFLFSDEAIVIEDDDMSFRLTEEGMSIHKDVDGVSESFHMSDEGIMIDDSDMSFELTDDGMRVQEHDNESGRFHMSDEGIMIDDSDMRVRITEDEIQVSNDGEKEVDVSVRSSADIQMMIDEPLTETSRIDVMMDDGTAVQIDGGNGSLKVQVRDELLPNETRTSVAKLEGSSVLLITDEADVDTFGTLVEEEHETITDVSVETDVVAVTYTEPAKFLGVFETTLTTSVRVDAEGSVSVKSPWYSFLYSGKDTETRASNVRAALSTAEVDLALSEEADTAVRARTTAQTISVVVDAVNAQVAF